MCPNNDDNSRASNRGRPSTGVESKSIERKFRIEPYIDHRLTEVCRTLGINRSEAIRQGVLLFLREANRLMQNNETYY